MKNTILLILALKMLILTSCEEEKDKIFTLEGVIEGPNTEFLVLHYMDSLDNYLSDTLKIKNNKFFIKRSLNNTQQVTLTSNLTGDYMEDPNRLMFFLEPGKINISLKENFFSEAEISGSTTQRENENLNRKTKPYFQKIEKLSELRQELIDERKKTNDVGLDKRIDSLTGQWIRVLDKIKEVKLDYAIDHGDSYLSADIIRSYSKTISRDSLEMLYDNLTYEIKESRSGNKIKEQLELYVVDLGDKAPEFTGNDINGKAIKLSQFKGKVVLLDFTAGWCVPCIKKYPTIKNLYKDYHTKGLEIVSVSFDKNEREWKENVVKQNLTWHHVYDGLDNVGKEGTISKLFSIQPIPAYILIDESGVIVNRYGGADRNNKSFTNLEEDLKQLITY